MTRIALVPSAYPPSVGGVEELTRHLALALVAAGDEVEVWTGIPSDRDPETVEVRDGLVVRRFPMPLPATNWAAVSHTATTGWKTMRSLRRAVTTFRPDLIHVQCFGPNGAYAAALARITGVPLVVTLQGETLMDDADIFDISQVLRASLRSGLRMASAVTACSAFTLDDAVTRFGLSPGRGTVIPNGVALDGKGDGPMTAGESLAGRLGGAPYVLALGRVVEKKGFDLLLSGYAAMDPTLRTADLVIGGTGPALVDLEAQAEESGIAARVHFVGRLTREQVAEAMAGAAVFVMPSRLEPFGIVVLEGWRAGTAVVATNRGGAPEFIRDGEDGLLVDPFDTAAVAGVLERILSDNTLRQSIAEAGRARVEEFAWPIIAGRYRDLYASVCAGATRTHRRAVAS
ncbi:MAG: glycosyltransferase family 4 protein [Acidimicrobiales bacterium]|jgi:glycogen(starch) synthase